jgi:uncharacterized protein YceH (UPF0502 family)
MLKFTSEELRVIGCLIEKSLTTPEHYPLSLNALTNACNQKSNREPVLSLSEINVQNSVDSLNEKRVLIGQSGSSSRVIKYKHRFCNTEFGDLQLTPQELGIICVLFLRGPQTPGELRTRTARLCEFVDVHETESVLSQMGMDKENPFVVKLERLPGKRESRFAHCFGKNSFEVEPVSLDKIKVSDNEIESNDRVSELEEKVELMQMEIDDLREKMEGLLS